jgi:flagellar hook-associated protein 2
MRTNMIARFARSETAVGGSKSTLTLLQNQIAQWNKSTN